MRRLIRIFALAALVLAPPLAHAVEPEEMLSDPKLEARARVISAGLRCLVCQNESIDDSNAALAHDIRVLVRERLLAGDSDQQIRDFLVSRYGNFVLLKPPFEPGTYLLWLTPLLLLLGGGGAIFWNTRRKAAPTPAAELTAGEKARLAAIVTPPKAE
ncbi:MAG: cytochrome c-type biogenesis protein [Pseudomonadota bacterium]